MRHHESTFFCERGEIPKVVVKSTGDQAYEAYLSFVSENGLTRQITIFFATIDDLREFCKNVISNIADLSESGVRG